MNKTQQEIEQVYKMLGLDLDFNNNYFMPQYNLNQPISQISVLTKIPTKYSSTTHCSK